MQLVTRLAFEGNWVGPVSINNSEIELKIVFVDFYVLTFSMLSMFFVLFQFFAIIVFGCISSSGWFFMQKTGQEVCVMNMDSSACHFSTMVGIVAFIASIGFLVGEWYLLF